MNCGYKEKTILYFYGELPGREAAAVEKHLGGCASCAGDLAVLKGLAARFDLFSPEPPRLSASELVGAAREPGFWETALSALRGAALAGACTAALLLAFQLMGAHKDARAVWTSEIDSNLDNIEYGIYSLEDDMLSSSSGDFDFRYAGIETQQRNITEKTTPSA